MADPYVNWAPANVGACSATWYVGPETFVVETEATNPTFGRGGVVASSPSNSIVGAWDFLVPGPLKDVLTSAFTPNTLPLSDYSRQVMERWAAAGGRISIVGTDKDGGVVYGASAAPLEVGPMLLGDLQMGWSIAFDQTLYPPTGRTPFQWAITFSVAHSLTR